MWIDIISVESWNVFKHFLRKLYIHPIQSRCQHIFSYFYSETNTVDCEVIYPQRLSKYTGVRGPWITYIHTLLIFLIILDFRLKKDISDIFTQWHIHINMYKYKYFFLIYVFIILTFCLKKNIRDIYVYTQRRVY